MEKKNLCSQAIILAKQEFTKKHSILSNTLRTFAIQGVVLVVALPLFAFSFTSMIPVALAGLLYVPLGYKFLHPFLRHNWLSVLGLPMFLGLLLVASFALGHYGDNNLTNDAMQFSNLPFLLNYQATMFVIVVIGYLEYFVNYLLLGNIMFVPRDFFWR